MTKLPTQPIPKKNPNKGYVRIPEPLACEERCPHCGAENLTDRQHHVWRVVDERGMHRECDDCATCWWPDGRILKPR